MAPRIRCQQDQPPACSEHNCQAPLPRGCVVVATEEGLGRVCRGWSGERPDCMCLEETGRGPGGVKVHLVELKAAGGLLERRGGARALVEHVARKVESSLRNLGGCMGAQLGRVVVSLPLEDAGLAVADRLARMLWAAIQGKAERLVLVDCRGAVWRSLG